MLGQYWKPVLIFYSTVLGYGSSVIALFPNIFNDKKWIRFPLSFGTGNILLVLLSFILFLMNLVLPGIAPYGAGAIFFCGIGLLLFRIYQKDFRAPAFFGLLVLILILVIRMAFLSKLVLPPYSDSPTHYLILLNLLKPGARPDTLYSFDTIFQHYYHFGFHTLAAWMALVTNETSPLLLALLGQFFLIAAPFSVFSILGALTGSKFAAWTGALLAALGWLMPAFGINWGKYPTIAGIAVLPVPLVFAYLSSQYRPKKLGLLLIALMLIGVVLLHSRMGMLLGLSIVAYTLTKYLEDRFLKIPWQVGFVMLLVTGLSYWGWLRPDLTGYYRINWQILLSMIIFLPVAWLSFSTATLSTLFFLAGIGILTTIPAPYFLRAYSFQMLDRPFVQLCLFLPFSILTSVGFTGLHSLFSGQTAFSKHLSIKHHQGRENIFRIGFKLLVPIILGLNLIQTISFHPFYPDRCCSYGTADDIKAFRWLEKNASPSGMVVIPGIRTSTRILETDAGAWTYAITGIHTKKRSYNSNLSEAAFIQDICQEQNEVYLYASGGTMSFRANKLHKDIENYKFIFSSGNTEIFQVISCLK